MDHRIIKAIVVGPWLSADLRSLTPSKPAVDLLSYARVDGVTLFLSAVSQSDSAELRTWYGHLDEPAVKANIRLLSPGRFTWPGGEVRFPFGSDRSAKALLNAKPAFDAILEAAHVAAVTDHDPEEDVLSILGFESLADDLRRDLFKAGNATEAYLTFDPEAEIEGETGTDGTWVQILGPDAPSTSWFDAVVRMERFDPTAVALVESPGKAGAVLANLQARLRAAQTALAGRADALEDAAPAILDTLPSEVILAARIAAPSAIHFVDRWSEPNRRYVRAGFWRATETASRNRAEAQAVLKGLDADRYGRAAWLADAADRSDGSQVFDDFSGAVCFAPGFYEFDLEKPTGRRGVDSMLKELKSYFDEKLEDMPFDRPLLRRRLFSNSLVLLRGEGYYANLKQTPPWDRAQGYVTEAKALAQLARKLLEHPAELNLAFKACLGPEAETAPAWKMLVATLDQARNLGLITLSVAMHQWRRSDTWEEVDLILQASRLVELHYSIMLGDRTLKGGEVMRIIRDAANRAATELEHLVETETARAKSSDWYEPGQPIRGWREADNAFENLLVGLLAAGSVPAGGDPAFAIGVFWGGVELPIAAHVAARVLDRPIDVHGFMSMGRYSGSANKDDEIYCDLSTGEFQNFETVMDTKRSKVLLLDDNALSGQTLESVRDLLLSYGAPSVETWVVRFSGERREGQMRMAGSGIVHPAYLDGRLQGCLGETPYARSYSRKQYESPVGVFNVARSRILRYLHSNGFASIFKREGF